MAGEEWERVFAVDMLGVWSTVRAALPQIVDRQGHVIVVSSVYAFVNGFLNSPYAAAKAGVEALGRSLRAELTPLGSSASVAYFGWVDTKMVQDAAEQQHFDRLQNQLPAFMNRRIDPAEAAAAVVRGIEERSPRIFAPRWWRFLSALRGVINPLLDRRLEKHPDPTSITREIESEADQRGAAAVEAARR
jgi:NAD(P)-dependent dehydrogenase (short-subunit alcohol dehydrogenase family)